jgi:toxin ParE1/3/4
MPSVTYLPEAESDLFSIWRYVHQESQSLEIADRLVEKIDAAAMTYAGHPLMGELRPDLAEVVRCFSVGNYVVFYVPTVDGIEVVQIIHGARDVPLHFRKPR